MGGDVWMMDIVRGGPRWWHCAKSLDFVDILLRLGELQLWQLSSPVGVLSRGSYGYA
jgi:hypothetical protein